VSENGVVGRIKYDKLVRDKIPEIIESRGEGRVAVTRVLDDDEYKVYLEKKLDEEVAEFHESKSFDELADILEVVFSLGCVYGYEAGEILLAQEAKYRERGGFSKRILLEEVQFLEVENE
jgi:predicted house-cleaning noncanonical NTP pyrophosphatase (MazG superfamily)